MKDIFTEISQYININSDTIALNKSSHWQHYTKNFEYDQSNNKVKGISGFGGNQQTSFLKQIYHNIGQYFVFSKLGKYKKYPEYKQAKEICLQQARCLDLDMLRNVFTLDMLKKELLQKQKISKACIIGDGQSNFCSLALNLKSFDKLIHVNLPEVLLNDTILLARLNTIVPEQIKFAQTKEQITKYISDNTTKLILVSAAECDILRNLNIELFINIASMQEMTNKLVDNYFEIIKSNTAYFYCCNRENKTLMGGEELIFEQYPWGDCKIMLDELCPWHQSFYAITKSLKFIHKYDGPIRHRLVKFYT